jgi:hypothetical protein
MKLLDNDRRSLLDVLAEAERLAKINSGWFLSGSAGIFESLLRAYPSRSFLENRDETARSSWTAREASLT